jgi:6-pyruvoyltetrahydropterin/6-carboxytetrahydropterin synthase
MTYKIWKRFEFSASHQLTGLPEGHQCARLHGHNYQVELELAAVVLDENGFVKDYGELAPFAQFLKDACDHRHMNDVMETHAPTAENLARWLHETAVKLLLPRDYRVTAVRVSETPNTWAEYRP